MGGTIHGGGLIRNVVFDIGWVFVHLDHQPFLDFLADHGADAPDLESVLVRIALDDHECGRMDGRGLLERCAALAQRPMSLEAAHASWVGMFELQPAMVDAGPAPERALPCLPAVQHRRPALDASLA